MKLLLICFISLLTFAVSYGQESLSIEDLTKNWPAEQLSLARISNDAGYMTQKERDVIFICNLARLNGPLFISTVLEPYLDSKNNRSDRFVKTLTKTLEQQNPLPAFKADQLLYQLALDHAKTSGARATTGHNGFDKRFKQAKASFWTFAENLYYGDDDALEIALELLIDKGINDLGHRKNILHRQLGFVGVSIQPHRSNYRFNCVMDFGGTR